MMTRLLTLRCAGLRPLPKVQELCTADAMHACLATRTPARLTPNLVVSPPSLGDVPKRLYAAQNYASAYTGHARISRMMFIADNAPTTQMQLEALKIAAEEARQVVVARRHEPCVCVRANSRNTRRPGRELHQLHCP